MRNDKVADVRSEYSANNLILDTQNTAALKFKKTEVGIIPQEWEAKRIGDDIILLSGHHVMAQYCNARGEGFPYITGPADFPNGVIVNTKFTTKPTTICKTNDILITVKGSGSGTLVESNSEYCISRQLMAIRAVGLNSKFLMYSLLQNGTNIKNAATGLIPGLSRSDILEQLIPIPKVSKEQDAIANALSDVDALITSLEKLIAKKRAIKTATMQQLLTGKTRLPPFDKKHTGYKQTELGEIPEDWEVVSLESISAFITKGSTPTTYGFRWEKDGIPFLRSECVSEAGLEMSESMFISVEANKFLRRSEVSSGDILITITGNVGRVIRLEKGFDVANINQHIAKIKIISDQVDSCFINHYLSQAQVRKYFNSITTGQAYPQISLAQVRSAQVPRPSIDEQVLISKILTSMSEELIVLESRLKKTVSLKQGMMQELLTGRTRLI